MSFSKHAFSSTTASSSLNGGGAANANVTAKPETNHLPFYV
ncbi:hypothetical protein DOY81_002938 [Sarcophaga bullata]|nr:hypothetical protein DOY81_002938 [Sarcophaga bullata]